MVYLNLLKKLDPLGEALPEGIVWEVKDNLDHGWENPWTSAFVGEGIFFLTPAP